MNIYEYIVEKIKLGEKEDKCPCTVTFDSKKEKWFKNKTFEQIQKEASKYGLYVKYDDVRHCFHDNPTYIFSLEPYDDIIARITHR